VAEKAGHVAQQSGTIPGLNLDGHRVASLLALAPLRLDNTLGLLGAQLQ
jgi:hypothetical protein